MDAYRMTYKKKGLSQTSAYHSSVEIYTSTSL